MEKLIVEASAYRLIAQRIEESPYSIPDISEKLNIALIDFYSLLTGVKSFTVEQIIELSFHINLDLSEVIICKHHIFQKTIDFLNHAIGNDRTENTFTKQIIQERIESLLSFINYKHNLSY